MEQSINFRPEVAEDEEFLARLYATTRDFELDLLPWGPEQKSAFLQSQFSLQRQHYRRHYPNAAFLIIESNGAQIGRMYVDRSESDILLMDIALMPRFRGKGLGGQLMAELLAEAGAAHKAVRIHVERNNPALHLYERLRFRVIEDKGVHYMMEWRADEARTSA
jgi:ribosomal protein S18 acetylase RimI-like enzyme